MPIHATRRALTALSRSNVAWRFIHNLGDVPNTSARSSAAAAVIPRLPFISSFSRVVVHPSLAARAACVTPRAQETLREEFRRDEMDSLVVWPWLCSVSGNRQCGRQRRFRSPIGRPPSIDRLRESNGKPSSPPSTVPAGCPEALADRSIQPHHADRAAFAARPFVAPAETIGLLSFAYRQTDRLPDRFQTTLSRYDITILSEPGNIAPVEKSPPDVPADVCGQPLFASCARRGAMDGQERRAPI